MPDKPAPTDTQPTKSGLQFQPRAVSSFQLQISERRLLLMLGDLLAALVSVCAALYIWSRVARMAFTLDFVLPQVSWFVALPVLWLFLARANDFYNLRLTARVGRSLARLVLIELQLFVVYLVIFFLSSRDALPRLFILYYAALSFVLIGIWRLWRPFLIGWSGSRRRALIIGTGPTAEIIMRLISQEAAADYEVLGFIGSSAEGEAQAGLLGTGKDLPSLVQLRNVSELIIAYNSELPADVFQGIMTCYEQGITIVPMPILYEQITGRVPIEHVGMAHWAVVLPLQGRTLSFNLYLLSKRVLDIVLALFGLTVFAVILIPLAILMELDSRGPIFYRQERVGRGGRLFKVVKLRSMIPDAEKHTGPKWATSGDPRVTRMGRIFRKTRLDEVPQLINVLRGEMSVVGPRPERPVFVDELTQKIPFYRTRLVVTPGLTGWAQVRYHYGSTVEDALIKLQYDLYYIRHRSLMLDVLIMLRTVGQVLSLGGT